MRRLVFMALLFGAGCERGCGTDADDVGAGLVKTCLERLAEGAAPAKKVDIFSTVDLLPGELVVKGVEAGLRGAGFTIEPGAALKAEVQSASIMRGSGQAVSQDLELSFRLREGTRIFCASSVIVER